MTRRSLPVLLALVLPTLLIAQSPPGIVTGVVVDGGTGGPVPNVRVEIDGRDVGATTDLRGSFRIDVAEGSYTVVARLKGYSVEKVTGVTVRAGKVETIGVVLTPTAGSAASLSQSAEVVVTASVSDSTEEALIVERRTAEEISDNIGAREMTRGSVTTAASAVQRVVGVSLVDDKYVFVRGLGERYSSTRLNGTLIPSTEPEKKVVPLDLFPSGLLEKITIAKSYTPDKPGEFAGGLVDLESSDFPSSGVVTVTANGSYNTETTHSDFGRYAGGLTFLGGGGQALPDIPSTKLVRKSPFGGSGFTAQELQSLGQKFVGTWQPETVSAPLGGGGSLSLASTVGKLGVLLSATWSHPYSRVEESQTFYGTSFAGIFPRNTYSFVTSEESIKQGYLANLAYKLDDANRIKLRGFYTDSSGSEARAARYFDEDESNFFQDARLRYRTEKIKAGQLGGEHYLEGLLGSGTFIDWKASYSEGTRGEDLRQTLYEETSGGLFYKSGGQSGFFLYSDLTDRIFEGYLDLTSIIGPTSNPITLKVGGAYTSGDRDFSSRRFRFVEQPNGTLDFRLPADKLFAASNISPTGFEITEETRTTDTYSGTNRVAAGYAMGDLTLGALRLVAGARIENAKIDVDTFDLFNPNAAAIRTALDDTDLLPAVSAVLTLSPKSNLRGSFSQTLNRPQFRELAPFEFTDLAGGRATIGNPNLRRARIRNYDVRWELFPSGREVVAFSLFYKDLEDPIERVVQPTATLRTTFANVASARNLGAEAEVRMNFGNLSPSLSALTLVANYTYVHSRVNIGQISGVVLTSTERALAGQSDHVVNATLELAPTGTGLSLQVFYNYTGERISDVGALGLPDILEGGRSTLDFTWAQELRALVPGLSLKASAGNLLDDEIVFTQGGFPQRSYRDGRKYTLSLKYALGL